MRKQQIAAVLRDHGLSEGRCIDASKTGYSERYPNNFVVFNAQVLWPRGRILKQVDLDLTFDSERLNEAARAVGANLYVLEQHRPHVGWERLPRPMIPVLRHAVWWTRIHAKDADVFLPADSAQAHSTRQHLACSVGCWQGRPAYAVDVWLNPAWYNQHMSGAVIDLLGRPPQHLRVVQRSKGNEQFEVEPCQASGQAVQPVLRQESGLLEFVWFSHGAAVPAVLYDNTIGLRDGLTFAIHAGCEAIHIRWHRKVIGLIWPCSIYAPEVVANARAQLKVHAQNPQP